MSGMIKSGGVLVPLLKITANNSDYVDFESGFSALYDHYQINGDGITISSINTVIASRFKKGGVWDGTALYAWHVETASTSGNTHWGAASNTATEINLYETGNKILTAGGSNQAGFVIEIFNPLSATLAPELKSRGVGKQSATNAAYVWTCGAYQAAGPIEGIRIFPTDGQLVTGVFELFGVKKP